MGTNIRRWSSHHAAPLTGVIYFDVGSDDGLARLDHFETSNYARVLIAATVNGDVIAAEAYLALNVEDLIDRDWDVAHFEQTGLSRFLAGYATVANRPLNRHHPRRFAVSSNGTITATRRLRARPSGVSLPRAVVKARSRRSKFSAQTVLAIAVATASARRLESPQIHVDSTGVVGVTEQSQTVNAHAVQIFRQLRQVAPWRFRSIAPSVEQQRPGRLST